MNTLIGILVVLLIANHYNLYKACDSGIRGRLIFVIKKKQRYID